MELFIYTYLTQMSPKEDLIIEFFDGEKLNLEDDNL